MNNTVFTHSALKGLPGGREDESGLKVLFTTLGFDVKVHPNLTAEDMISTAREYSKKVHNGVFFLIILSHGTTVCNRDAVVGTDGAKVTVDELEKLFHTSNCPSLNGVPKIFMIDACRGSQEEKVYKSKNNVITKGSYKSLSSDASVEMELETADSAHFAFIYASTYGNVAYTHAKKGSYLTQTFVKVTSEAPPDKTFTKIIQQVKRRIQKSGVQQTVEFVDRLHYDYYIKRDTAMASLQELHRRFHIAVKQWVPVREITIQEIQKTIENLKLHHRNVNISRISGSSVSILGSALAIAGFAIAPVTFGGSLALSIVGIAGAFLGGATSAVASIADIIIQKSNVKHAQEQLKRDYEQLTIICEIAKKINETINDTKEKCQGVRAVEFFAIFTEIVAQSVTRTGNVGIRVTEAALFGAITLEVGVTAVKAGGTIAKGIATAGIVLNAVLIPIDLIEIVRSSVSLVKGSETKAVEQLTKIVVELEEVKQDLKKRANIRETST